MATFPYSFIVTIIQTSKKWIYGKSVVLHLLGDLFHDVSHCMGKKETRKKPSTKQDSNPQLIGHDECTLSNCETTSALVVNLKAKLLIDMPLMLFKCNSKPKIRISWFIFSQICSDCDHKLKKRNLFRFCFDPKVKREKENFERVFLFRLFVLSSVA